MFGLFRRSKDKQTPETTASTTAVSSSSVISPVESDSVDLRLIAVITAAIARFRESEGAQVGDAGFIVRRVRRI